VESINPSTDNVGDLGGDGDGFLYCNQFDTDKCFPIQPHR